MAEDIKLNYSEENKEELINQYENLQYEYLTRRQIAEFVAGEVLRVYELGVQFGKDLEKARLYNSIIEEGKQHKGKDDTTSKEG